MVVEGGDKVMHELVENIYTSTMNKLLKEQSSELKKNVSNRPKRTKCYVNVISDDYLMGACLDAMSVSFLLMPDKECGNKIDMLCMTNIQTVKNHLGSVDVIVPHDTTIDDDEIFLFANSINCCLGFVPECMNGDKASLNDYAEKIFKTFRVVHEKKYDFEIQPVSGYIEYLFSKKAGVVTKEISKSAVMSHYYTESLGTNGMELLKNRMDEEIADIYRGEGGIDGLFEKYASLIKENINNSNQKTKDKIAVDFCNRTKDDKLLCYLKDNTGMSQYDIAAFVYEVLGIFFFPLHLTKIAIPNITNSSNRKEWRKAFTQEVKNILSSSYFPIASEIIVCSLEGDLEEMDSKVIELKECISDMAFAKHMCEEVSLADATMKSFEEYLGPNCIFKLMIAFDKSISCMDDFFSRSSRPISDVKKIILTANIEGKKIASLLDESFRIEVNKGFVDSYCDIYDENQTNIIPSTEIND